MSENENPPSKQTSSIPLKKETVRVTLKASDAAPAAPSAPAAPPAPSVKPPVPTSAAPPAPSAPAAPSVPAPAPTIALRPAGAPTAPAPAPTIRLNTAPPPGAPTVSLKPPGGAGGGSPTLSLPKATVQLQAPTQPIGSASSLSQAATLRTADEEEEDASSETLTNATSVIGFLAAAAVLVIQCLTVNFWEGWDKLF